MNVARRRLLFLAPAGLTVAGGAACYGMLAGMRSGRFDPHDVGNPLVGKPVPDFTLADQPPGHGFSAADLRRAEQPILVNFFASWCIPCVEEAPELDAVRSMLPIWGVAYKDKPEDANGFVRRTGDAYARLGADRDGTVAINWGVTGVPESFLVDARGIVAWHYSGPLTQAVVSADLMPRLA